MSATASWRRNEWWMSPRFLPNGSNSRKWRGRTRTKYWGTKIIYNNQTMSRYLLLAFEIELPWFSYSCKNIKKGAKITFFLCFRIWSFIKLFKNNGPSKESQSRFLVKIKSKQIPKIWKIDPNPDLNPKILKKILISKIRENLGYIFTPKSAEKEAPRKT